MLWVENKNSENIKSDPALHVLLFLILMELCRCQFEMIVQGKMLKMKLFTFSLIF